jgi:hypothetical protein
MQSHQIHHGRFFQSGRGIFLAAITFTGVSIVSNGFALIGETVLESDARYGAPVKICGEVRSYLKDDFKIDVHFANGLADALAYTRIRHDRKTSEAQGHPEELTFEEIATLLDNNSRGEEWKDLAKGYDPDYQQRSTWKCKKYLLEADYDGEGKTLNVFGKNFGKLCEIYARRPEAHNEKLTNILGL